MTMWWRRGARVVALAGGLALTAACVVAQAPDKQWRAVREVFQRRGAEEGKYLKLEFPRTDLSVHIGSDALAPSFEFTSYFGFAPQPKDRVLAMGEVVLVDSELAGALAAARTANVTVTALHNHLVGETPRILYLHVMADGEARDVAQRLQRVILATAAPRAEQRLEPRPTADWSPVDRILGPHEEAAGPVAAWEFPLRESLTIHGYALESTGALETASEVVFQSLGNGRFATTGELFLRPEEVSRVVRTLDAGGILVTAVHSHTMDEEPRRYWVHWYGTGNAVSLATVIARAIGRPREKHAGPH